jgi:hypothetical protein
MSERHRKRNRAQDGGRRARDRYRRDLSPVLASWRVRTSDARLTPYLGLAPLSSRSRQGLAYLRALSPSPHLGACREAMRAPYALSWPRTAARAEIGKGWLISGPYLRASCLGARGPATRAPYLSSIPWQRRRGEGQEVGRTIVPLADAEHRFSEGGHRRSKARSSSSPAARRCTTGRTRS